MQTVFIPVNLKSSLYPMILKAIRANFGVIAAVLVGYTLISAYVRLHLASAVDLDTTVVMYTLLDFSALLIADTVILLAVYPYFLSGGQAYGWTTIRNTKFLTVLLFCSASFGLLVLMSMMIGVVGAAGSLLRITPETAAFEELAVFGFSLCMVVTLTVFGLAYPQIISTGKLALTQVASWGLRQFLRLFLLLAAGSLPTFLISTRIGLWAEEQGLYAQVLAEWPLIDWPSLTAALIENFFTFATSIAAAAALCKVYREVAPLDEYSSPDAFGEVFD